MTNWKAITRARSKVKPAKAKLSQADIDSMVTMIAQGWSYYGAGKNYGVSGSTARYHWRRWVKLREQD